MTKVSVIEPRDGWHVGDRAYCVCGSRLTKPTLETGRVYRVAEVIPVANHVCDGLVIAGVQAPNDMRGFYSSRFVKLSGRAGALRHIDRSVTPVSMEAYWANQPHPEPAREEGE